MVNLLYKYLWLWFGIKSVLLVDFDSSVHSRLVWVYRRGDYVRYRVTRYSGVSHCVLDKDGTFIANPSYVTSWRPIYPKNWNGIDD